MGSGYADSMFGMPKIGTPMLFSPPEAPLSLRPRDTVVLGRSRSCDLRVGGGDSSRRHAEITGDADGFMIRDLGSTNGTFVNDERVSEHRLHPGDRIQIGASTITFCEVGGGLDALGFERDDTEKTMLVERPTAGQVFEGELAEVPPFAVLQMLEMGRKTGLFSCDSVEGVGRIWLEHGAPVHADTKSQTGFDAALAIVNATSGRFTFQPVSDPPERTIQASVTELLLEASRALDEGLL
jgi:pSer/pThr/pTyr-binding forkhead associated (FHA) protein